MPGSTSSYSTSSTSARSAPSSAGSSYTTSTSTSSSSSRRRRTSKHLPTHALLLSNLPEGVRHEELYDMCRGFGAVARVVVPVLPRDKHGVLLRDPYAYVHYIHLSHAEAALRGLQGRRWGCLVVGADWAKPPKPT